MKEKQSKDDLLEAEPTIRSSRRKSHIRDTLRLILFSPRGAPQVDATRPQDCYYALFECVTRTHNEVACRHFIVHLPGRFFASFGTQLGNHPLGMIGLRLLGVDKSVSSIRLTVIKCFWGCTRHLAALQPPATFISVPWKRWRIECNDRHRNHGFFHRNSS